MLLKRPHYQIPSLTEAQSLLERIKEQFPLTELPSQLWEYVYYDTFDSRLFKISSYYVKRPELTWKTNLGFAGLV